MIARGFEFFLIALRSTIYRFADQVHAIAWYWRFPNFFFLDLDFHWQYALTNSFKLCRLHWGGESDRATYGETPLKTWADIATLAPIKPADRVLDLGCGRGRGAFWLASCIGCDVIGVDAVETFSRRGNALARAHGLERRVRFLARDLFAAPFEEVTVIYFYGTGLGQEMWIDLAIWLADLPQAPLIITVSQSLSEFSPHFQSLGQCELEFGWGKTSVHWQRAQVGLNR